MKNHLFQNYKTSVPALATLLIIGLNTLKVIDNEQTNIFIGLLTSVGLIGSKDA